MLTNAEMALLTEDAEAEEEPTARGRRKRRDSATLRGDKLTEEQITQVGLLSMRDALEVPIALQQTLLSIMASQYLHAM